MMFSPNRSPIAVKTPRGYRFSTSTTLNEDALIRSASCCAATNIGASVTLVRM
jgi:hypothetical protein